MKIIGKLCESGEAAIVTLDGDKIQSVEAAQDADKSTFESALGGADVWIAPGFIDVQVNGYGGYDFNRRSWTQGNSSDEASARIVELLDKAGTVKLCPTIVTSTDEGITESMRGISDAIERDKLADAIPAIHLEGPYISSEDGARGAHPLECVCDPNWEQFRRFQDAANGRIKILTLAPERDGALAFIEKATAAGIVISIGHTAASPQQIRDAVKAGARKSTHLGNGSHAMIPRHQNYIWEQLAADELTAGIITDGHHLPPAVMKVFARAKPADKLVIVSDAVALGGRPPGLYDEGRHEVLPSGKVVLAGTPYLAGAGHLLDTCVANALRFTDLGMSGVARAIGSNPAKLLELENTGAVKAGFAADLTLFRLPQNDDAPLQTVATIRAGEVVYRA